MAYYAAVKTLLIPQVVREGRKKGKSLVLEIALRHFDIVLFPSSPLSFDLFVVETEDS